MYQIVFTRTSPQSYFHSCPSTPLSSSAGCKVRFHYHLAPIADKGGERKEKNARFPGYFGLRLHYFFISCCRIPWIFITHFLRKTLSPQKKLAGRRRKRRKTQGGEHLFVLLIFANCRLLFMCILPHVCHCQIA